MIAIVDYGAGNLGSVSKAFRYIDAPVVITRDIHEINKADALVLPGVGAFYHCMDGLEKAGLTDTCRNFIRSGRPFLGICVGLQMLFDASEEKGDHPGLGILPGKVVKFRFDKQDGVDTLKIPHIGWNALSIRKGAKLFEGLGDGDRVYFVHSYYPEPADQKDIAAETEYGIRFCCSVEHDNVYATQFHPEKSGAVGLQILKNFVRLTR
jgi:glutamine amidotransferase